MKILKIAAVRSNRVTEMVHNENGTVSVTGILKEFLQILISRLNISYSIVEPNDQFEYGSRNSDGSWNGMVGLIANNRCDMSLTPLDVTFDRLSAISFSTTIKTTPYTIITNGRYVVRNRLTDYILGISNSIWISLLVSALVVIHFELFRQSILHKPLDYVVMLWKFFRLLLNQFRIDSLDIYPPLYLTSFFGLCFVFIYTYINVHIKVELVVGSNSDKIDTLSQLAAAEHIVPVVYSGTSTESFFKDSNIVENMKIWKRIVANREISITSSSRAYLDIRLVDLLRNGRLALLELQNDALAMKSQYCNVDHDLKLYVSPDSFQDTPIAFGLNKHLDTETVNNINKIITHTIIHGFMNAWHVDATWRMHAMNDTRVKACVYDVLDNSYRPISMAGSKSLYFLLAFGFICGSLILAIEMISIKWKF